MLQQLWLPKRVLIWYSTVNVDRADSYLIQIILLDLVLAGDNAIIIGMVASQFPNEQRKKIIFWGIGAAIVLRIVLH